MSSPYLCLHRSLLLHDVVVLDAVTVKARGPLLVACLEGALHVHAAHRKSLGYGAPQVRLLAAILGVTLDAAGQQAVDPFLDIG